MSIERKRFIPLAEKKAMIKWSDKNNLLTAEEAENYNDVAFVPSSGYIVVDSDTEDATKNVQNLINKINAIQPKGYKVFSYPTTRGRHFVFKLPKGGFFDHASFKLNDGATVFVDRSFRNSNIDVKGNDKGYHRIRKNGKWLVDTDVLFKEFEDAPLCPISLLIPKTLKISIEEYKESPRDSLVFNQWLPKLRAKGMTKEQFVQFCIELKLIANDPETLTETQQWAEEKWNSSVNMGEVKDFTHDSENNKATPLWKCLIEKELINVSVKTKRNASVKIRTSKRLTLGIMI